MGDGVKGMNYGKLLGWTIATLSFGAALGYALAKDYRRALYWFFAGCITVVLTY